MPWKINPMPMGCDKEADDAGSFIDLVWKQKGKLHLEQPRLVTGLGS